jgi:hypothetical protein
MARGVPRSCSTTQCLRGDELIILKKEVTLCKASQPTKQTCVVAKLTQCIQPNNYELV